MVKRAAPDNLSSRTEGKKRVKHAQPLKSAFENFADAKDIQTALLSRDTAVLTQALITLRNQLTVRVDEDALTPQDERLLLAKSWLEKSPGAQDLFSIIEREPKPSPAILSLCLVVISCLLNLLSAHFVYHPLGNPIAKNLLTSSHMRQLNLNLSNANSELILSTLKVLNALSDYAGGVEKKALMDGFAWGQKSLQKLLFLRRRGKVTRELDPVTRPDIRTLYIFFILSFLSNTTPSLVKLSLLEQHRDSFLLIFKGISQDPYPVCRLILETCWEGIWNDPKIKRTLKIGLFNEITLNHLLKLYDRDSSEADNVDHIPADLIHHFMLAITTRPGVGICFKDRGWYSRDTSGDSAIKYINTDVGDEATKAHGGKIYNKILANIVRGLKVNEDARQQELTFKILEVCPELVSGYWGAVNLTLEPRLSSRWITNISILGTIISLPVPTSSFHLSHSIHYNPSPPPLSSVLANVLPSALNKSHLTKGLQSSSSLVQHCTALALAKCVAKLDKVLCAFRKTAQILEEDEETGQWLKRTREVENEVERRVPDFMVIIAIVQQKHTLMSSDQNNAKGSLLNEAALRLLWLYHKLFPRLAAEVRFDVGKLLLSVSDLVNDTTDEKMTNDDSVTQKGQSGLDVLRQLHVLRLLKESDQFTWSGKLGSSQHSYLHAIFTLYIKTPHLAVRDATSDLVIHILSSSLLFSHDPAELDLWLRSLPLTRRALKATAPDGTPLTDEGSSVLSFLDDCIQRCHKTPYRYLEEATAFFGGEASEYNQNDLSLAQDDPSGFPSPLLMTILEQLRAKVTNGLLSPSDTLAIATFIRKLTCGLVFKLRDLQHAWKLEKRVQEILTAPSVSPNSIVMRDAVKRESELLSRTLNFIQKPSYNIPISTSPAVQDFLTQVEDLPTPASESAAFGVASELVDWIRLIYPPLHPSELKRLFGIVFKMSPLASAELLYQLDPRLGQLWSIFDDNPELLVQYLPFEWAHLHSTPVQLAHKTTVYRLASMSFSRTAWNASLDRRISIGIHRLAVVDRKIASLRETELSLLVSIMRQGRSQQPAIDLTRLKHTLFLESEPIRTLGCSRNLSSTEQTELSELVRLSLEPQAKSDQELALEYCKYWTTACDTTPSLQSCTLALPWIPFMEPTDIIKHLDIVISATAEVQTFSDMEQQTVAIILETISRLSANIQVMMELQHRIQGLFAIRRVLPPCIAIDTLLLLILENGLPMGCNGLRPTSRVSCKLSDITVTAQKRWARRSASLFLDSTIIVSLLKSEVLDENISGMLSRAIYMSSAARHAFEVWLSQAEPPAASMGPLVIALHAYLDVMSMPSEAGTFHLSDAWFLAVVRSLLNQQNPDDVRTLCASCLRILFQVFPSNRAMYVIYISKEVLATHGSFLNPQFARLLHDLYLVDGPVLATTLVDVMHEALKWMVDRFSGDELSKEDNVILDELSQLLPRTETKPHMVEPVIKAAIQNCLHMPRVIRILTPLVSSTHLKPVIVNRQIQAIVQHSHLHRIADTTLPTREPVIQLLHALFYTHPNNTCQPSHIAPLTRFYGGTLSFSDRLLFSVFHLYESCRKDSAASIFRNWSPSSSAPPSQDTIRAIISLDAARVFRTCTTFPTRRWLDGPVVFDPQKGDDDLYDPVFLTLLVDQLLSEHKELSTSNWVQVFRTNIVSLVFCVLTSRNEAFRKVGLTTLAGICWRVEEADFLEKDQVIYILNILRDLLPSPTAMSAPRLPTYPVILLAHALRATFYPSSFLYPVVSRFLLQRPELDTTDVPMLYSLLYSSEDGKWGKERAWMIRFLTEAMNEGGARDWAVLKRRHTWDLVASLWQATRSEERSLRKGVLEFMANLSANQHAITSLILRSSVLTWIEMQLGTQEANELEYVAWLKILENIVITADGNKANKATRGEFTATLSRCLRLILAATVSDTFNISPKMLLVQLASRVLLCLANQPFGASIMLLDVLHKTTDALQNLESVIPWSDNTRAWGSSGASTVSPPPHRARGLFDLFVSAEEATGDSWYSMNSWAESVVTLWRVAMVLEHPDGRVDARIWDTLTCRLLILKTSPWVDSRSNDIHWGVVEWARRETLVCLLQEGEDVRMEI